MGLHLAPIRSAINYSRIIIRLANSRLLRRTIKDSRHRTSSLLPTQLRLLRSASHLPVLHVSQMKEAENRAKCLQKNQTCAKKRRDEAASQQKFWS
jgi:hypothetical protein